jgi:hypothetical protein
MRRPGYKEAVEWLAGNDDCHWLAEQETIPSVSACLIRDLFNVEEAKLYADIRRSVKRIFPAHPAVTSTLSSQEPR